MAEEIVFYHNPRSRAQMVHWMLEEAGAPYRIVPIDFDKGEHKAPSFLAINPMGKLPTIVHRGVVVTETAAIIAYIADNFSQAGLAPEPEDALRGAYYRWLFFGAGCFEPALIDKMMKRPEVERKAGSEIRWAMMFGAPGLKGEKVFDNYVARLSARPAAQRTAGG
jgi:glutathione S-transferase